MDINITAGRIASQWPLLIGQLPKELTEAITSYESVAYVEPPVPVFDTSAADPAKAIASLAADLASADAFGQAKLIASNTLARAVVRAAAQAVPGILDTVEDDFAAAVDEYERCVAVLPEGVTADILVNSDPSVLEAYQGAAAAAADLYRFDAWLSSLSELPAYAGHGNETGIRITAPSTRTELAKLLNASALSEAEAKLNPLWLTAAREGIPFRLVTPDEAAGVRAEIEAEPTPRFTPLKFARF